MAQTQEVVLDTQHTDMVHDSQFDYYGRYVATCSSDRTIKVFSVAQGNKELIASLGGHEGPVWMLSWAHPRFGAAFASCSYDHRAIVWKESNGQWKPVHIISCHTSSVNAVQWAPNEYGMMVATASSDGKVCVSSCTDGAWREAVTVGAEVTHPMGAMAVSFAPFVTERPPVLATGGCDGKVRLWFNADGSWKSGVVFGEHKDWVRDVAFCTDGTAPFVTLASCGQDKKVIIRRKPRDESIAEGSEGEWDVSTTTFDAPVWRLSWSPCGTMLLVTVGDEAFVLKPSANFTDEWSKAPVAQE